MVLGPLCAVVTIGLVRPDQPATQTLPVVVQPAAAAAATTAPPTVRQLPDGVQAPASVTGEERRAVPGLGVSVGRSVAVDGIPGRALTAYQRAATVINVADPTCRISWELIAAIGRVESDHGRFGGAQLDSDGVAHPAILGPRLTGGPGTSRIDDTDGGVLDGDDRVDRAVGPMQFIPSTWTVVGVDADGDDRRDPQDIDDAALASAVYLCAGSGDLSTLAGQRRAIFSYNHSDAYVDLVLRVMNGYLVSGPGLGGLFGGTPTNWPTPTWPTGDPGGDPGDGDGTPTATPSPEPTFEVLPTPTASPSPTTTSSPTPSVTPSATPSDQPPPSPRPTPTQTTTPTDTPSPSPSEAPPSETPTADPSPTGTPTPTDSPTVSPTGSPTGTPTPGEPTTEPTPGPGGDPLPDMPPELLEAWQACVELGLDPTEPEDLDALTDCLVEATGLPADDPDLLALLATPPVTPPQQETLGQSTGRHRPRRPSRRR